MIKLGMLIGGRYEILDKIGTGGMSDVYKAKDQKLNRFVAVKVLKQEFSENKNFVSKFRVEAQAAAGLMHPNIVNVYDVGEEENIHYIVMELVEGITLKKYIEKKIKLTTKEAISIAIQVAMGIEAAHNNHIIHRDIKPQNIMISKEGKVKVTDFGIAKAASSNTITSNVMGSVHYTSPEQARGGFSDAKSDIYSMGITFFEMLTGRVPFNGDTTVAIAIKHIQDEMPSPREFIPEIPVSVEKIILKCTQKSPDRRYQTMQDMIKDLKRSLISPDEDFVQMDMVEEAGKTRVVPDMRSNMRTAEKVEQDVVESIETQNMQTVQNMNQASLQNTSQNTSVRTDRPIRREQYADAEDLQEMKKKRTSNANVASGQSKSGQNKNVQRQHKGNQSKPVKNAQRKANHAKKKEYTPYPKQDDSVVNRKNVRKIDYEADMDYTKEDREYDYNPKVERVTTILTIVAAVIIGCILLYYVGKTVGLFTASQTSENQTTQQEQTERAVMPEFVGKDIEEVKKELKSVNLGCKTTYVESVDYAKNVVISAALEDGQEVLANDKIIKNTTIVLTVSAGAEGISVPDVVGLSEAEGTAKLKNEGFLVTKVDEYSTEFARGVIISQSPEGDSIAGMESAITIVISKGAQQVDVRMPEVLGQTQEAAISTLEAAGLVVGKVEESYSSDYGAGLICYQSYVTGTTVNEGTTVDLKISIGSEIATYSCNLSIAAPADYTGGNAEVILTTADGLEQLWCSQSVTSFPVNISLSGFSSSSQYGIVTISYLKNVEEVVTDSDGNQTTQINQALTQTQQNVQFVKE